jgi:hypothetical protein
VTIPETHQTSDPDKFLCTVAGVIKYRSGAELLSDIGGLVGSNYFLLAGETTDAKMYSGADLIVYSDAGTTEVARIDGATGNISTEGTLGGLTQGELTQLGNIGTETISDFQWGYVGSMNQSVASSASVEFTSIVATSASFTNAPSVPGITAGASDLVLTAFTGTVQIAGNNLEFTNPASITTLSGSLTLNPSTTLEVTPNANFAAGIDVTGAITVTTTVDGVDVAGANAAEYVTMSLDANIANERVLTEGGGITITDNGAGSTVVIAANFGSIDHGGLAGLGDDDHTIYFLADGSRQLDGDLDFTGPQAITTTTGNLTISPANLVYFTTKVLIGGTTGLGNNFVVREPSAALASMSIESDYAAANAIFGRIYFVMEDSLAQRTAFAYIQAESGNDYGNEQGILRFYVAGWTTGAGTRQMLTLYGGDEGSIGDGEVAFNEDGLDFDFRIESDVDAYAFFVRGSDSFVGMGASSPVNNELLLIQGEYSDDVDKFMAVKLRSDTASDGSLSQWYTTNWNGVDTWIGGISWNAYLNPAGPTWDRENTDVGGVIFQAQTSTTSGKFQLYLVDETGAFALMLEGLAADTLQNTLVVNTLGDDIDFRVEGNSLDDLFFINAGTDQVYIGGQSGADSTFALGLQAHAGVGEGAQHTGIVMGNIEGSGDSHATLQYLDYDATSWLADFFIMGNNLYYDQSADGWAQNEASLAGAYFELFNTKHAVKGANFALAFCEAGTPGTQIQWISGGSEGAARNVVINEAGSDMDFRVESSVHGDALMVDGGTGYVTIHSVKTTTGDPSGNDGLIYWNTVDNKIQMYADGAWRTLASW